MSASVSIAPSLAAAPSLDGCPFCRSLQTRVICLRTHVDRSWALARCSACGLHFTTPPPQLSDLARFYACGYHTGLCHPGVAERVFGRKFSRYCAWIRQFVRSGRSLDVGCSTGLLPRLLQQSGFAAEGIELNSESAAWGRAHYGVVIRNQPIESGEYEPESYDLVTLTDVLEHTIHPLTSLRAVHRIVKPGGCVLITFPDIRSLESRYYQTVARVLGRSWLWCTCHVPLHTWEFTRPTAIATFTAAGFELAGFRRSQPPVQHADSLPLLLLSLPLSPLALPFLARQWGTQMEFMLRKPAAPLAPSGAAAQTVSKLGNRLGAR
ncbi:MAG: class I SAM-dependent methyltransferase [Terriglobales bacterium]